MAKRGAKLGSFQQSSFTGKLMSLKPGQTIILPDTKNEGGPTRIERDLQTAITRQVCLEGFKFTSQRTRYISGDKLMPALIITRTR